MNSIELSLLELVGIAETPLYSAYCWLRRHLRGPLALSGFLEMVDGLVQRDVLRLWSVDIESGDRTELFVVPASLEHDYQGVEGLDDQYDPFGLSVSTGAANTVPTEEPEWEFDLIDDLQSQADQKHLESTKLGYRSALRIPLRLDGEYVATLAFLSLTPSKSHSSNGVIWYAQAASPVCGLRAMIDIDHFWSICLPSGPAR